MGGKNSSLKDRYFKSIRQQQKEYYKKNKQFMGELARWKSLVKEELSKSKEEFPAAVWPDELLDLLQSWKSTKDYDWTFNVLWFDYLQSTKPQSVQERSNCMASLRISIEKPQNVFEAQSLTEFISSHFRDPREHFISAMVIQFTKCQMDHISEFLISNDADPEAFTGQVVSEIKSFVSTSLHCMMFYYGKLYCKIMSEKPEEMYDMMLKWILNDNLSPLLVDLFAKCDFQKENKYSAQLEEHKDAKCKDLGIESNFQIDSGYDKVVAKLQSIERFSNPIDKIYIIYEMTRMICECVDSYWEGDSNVSASSLVIDANQVFSIFVYITIKARVPNLRAHIRLITEFARQSLQMSSLGYYLTTVEACIEHIELM